MAPPRRLLAVALAVVLGVAGGVVLLPGRAEAAVIRSFTPYFSTQTNGEIFITGNALETCDPSASNCTQALAGTANLGNNNFVMRFLDADDDSSTKSSSGATVRIPDGSRVLYAGLFWGAGTTAGTGGVASSGDITKIRLRPPGASAYQTVTATRSPDRLPNQGLDYSSYADITAIVRSAGAGRYFGADIPMATGQDRYGGWSIVVAYSNPSLPLRDLNVFGGYASVQNTDVVSTTISGFLTPAVGTVNARFGSVVYEGDQQLSGDYLTVDGTRLADEQSLSGNFFASRVTNAGANLTDRTPATLNSMALDAKVIDAPNIVPNGATSANLTFGTNGDYFYPAALTTQIDLYAPNVKGSKSVVDLAGHDPAQVGDVLEYTVALTNTGQDPAATSVLTDPLPPGVVYVPGSLRVASGSGTGTKTDAAGDDQAEYDTAGRVVRFRVGSGATATAGGTLAKDASTSVTFRARVLPQAAGTTVVNTAALDYTAQTLGKAYTYTTNDVSTPVATLADLSIVKTGPASVAAGQDVTYRLTVSNAGPSTATGVRVSDALPDGFRVTGTTGGTCTNTGGTLTCRLDPIGSGATQAVTVTGRTDAASDAGSIANSAQVTSDTSDPDLSNNTSAVSAVQTRSADLVLDKTAAPADPTPGSEVTWTLAVTNRGPSRATTPTLSDTLPAGFTVTDGPHTDSGTCTLAGGDVACALDDLDPGDRATVTVTARLDPAWTASDPLVNRAFVQSRTPDPNADNNTAAAQVTPAEPSADLVVTKETLTDPVVAGAPVRYRIRVTNRGPSLAGAVVVSDAVPDGLDDVSATAGDTSCTRQGPTVRCPVGDLAPGASVTVLLSGTLDAGSTGTLSNRARVDSATPDPVGDNDSDGVDDQVGTAADLSITKTFAPTPVQVGGDVTYTLTVRNDGPSDAADVVVVDDVPDPLVPGSVDSPDGSCTLTGRRVRCSLGTVPVGGRAVVTVRAQLPDVDVDPATIANTATVSSGTDDPETANNSATARLETARSADVSVTKDGPGTVTAGTAATWTFVVRNAGPSTATGVVATDDLPPGLRDVSVDDDACSITDGSVRCTVGRLPPGASRTVRVRGTLDPGSTDDQVQNAVTVTARTPDPTTSNNADSVTSAVQRLADLSLDKTGPATVTAGDRATWALRVHNAGPSEARSVVITDQLPSAVDDVDLPSGCALEIEAVTCTVGDLPPGADALVQLSGTVRGDTPDATVLTNRASVSSAEPDPNPEDNADAVDTAVSGTADLEVAKSVDPDPLVAGAGASYRVRVHNRGPSTAAGVFVVDDVPAGLSVTGVQASGPCEVVGQRVTCDLGTVAAGSSEEVQVEVQVAAAATGPLTNEGTGSSKTEDRVPGNNSTAIDTPVVESADVSLTKTVAPGTVPAGQAATYTLTAVNAGPSSAADVTVTDELPAGVELIEAPGCTLSDGRLTCPVGSLAAGQSASVSVVLQFPADFGAGQVRNEASVTSSTPDPEADNDTDAATVTVRQQADVSVAKSVSPGSLIPGLPGTYKLLVGNTGPSVARSVVLTDAVPAPLTVVSATDADGTPCDVAGPTVTCDLGTLGLRQTVVTVAVDVPEDYIGPTSTNAAVVTTSTADANPDNDRSEVVSPVVPTADLHAGKTVGPAPLVPGGPVRFTLTSTNQGPSTARDVTVDDILPYALLGAQIVPSAGGTCTLTPEPVDSELPENAGALRCVWGEVASGRTVSVVVTGTLRPDALGTLTNTTTTGSTTLDPDSTDNKATAGGPLEPAADVSVVKAVVAPPTADGVVSWTLTVRNEGPSTARDVVVTDDVPAPTSDLVATADDGQPCAVDDGAVSCSRSSLAPDAGFVVTISGRLPADATGTLANTATVTASTPDPDETNNTSTTASPVGQRSDLSVAKSLTGGTLVPGTNGTYVVTVTNAGPSVATDVRLSDAVPEPLTVLSATAANGSSCTVVGRQVTCGLGDLGVGSTSVDVVVGVPAGLADGTLTNTATVVTTTPDPDPGNNSASLDSPVVGRADLAVAKDVVGPVEAGSTVTWSVRLTSSGPSVARDVVLSDAVPASVSDVRAAADDGGPCVVEQNRVTCRRAELTPSEQVVVMVTGLLDADASGDLTNAAQVTATTDDPVPGNDEDSVTTPIETTQTPSPSPAPTSTTGEPGGSDSTGVLAGTGSPVELWQVIAVGGVLVAGAVLLLTDRRASRRRGPTSRRRT